MLSLSRLPAVYINYQDHIGLSYSHLRNGEVSAGNLCPACNGGSSKERTLSVGRTGGRLWWRCWRASCPCKGSLQDNAVIAFTPRSENRKRLHYQTRSLTKDEETFLATKVSNDLLPRVRYTDQYGGRYCFPMISRTGRTEGYVLRTYDKDTKPKVLNDEYDRCSWHGDLASPSKVVIVEDIPSAAKIGEAHDFVGVALLGTTCTSEKLSDILDARAKYYIVCLDEDATNTAVALTVKLSKFAKCMVVPLTKDIKDFSKEELDSFLKKIRERYD